MIMDLLSLAIMQLPHNGVRKTRWFIIRNTYNELKNTTLKTWADWVPVELGVVKMTSPPSCKVVMPNIGDDTRVEAEFIFLALDREEDQAKLRSLEVTGGWFNEAQFANEEIVRVALQRTGRYPKLEKDDNGVTIESSGATWSGLLLDFNMVDTEHFLFKAFETEKRAGWRLFRQPPAIMEVPDPDGPPDEKRMMWVGHPDAENIQNLKSGYNYYLTKISSMVRSQILVDFCAQWGITVTGQPVFQGSYDDDYHMASEELKADKTLPVLMGVDFGLHPAMVFGQQQRDGRFVILKELDPNQPSGVSLQEFIEDYYRPFINEHFVGVRSFESWGDPAGRGRSGLDKSTPYMMLAGAGIRCTPANTNEFLIRKEAVEMFLNKRNGITINPSCVRLRKGFMGAYGYKKTSTGVRPTPEKNEFSHIHDALQYLALGVLGGGARKKATGGSNGLSY
jgi:hypothetical protein